jgi:hypothetical protein
MHIFRGTVIRKLILPKKVDSTDRKIYPYIPEHSGMMPHDRCPSRSFKIPGENMKPAAILQLRIQDK